MNSVVISWIGASGIWLVEASYLPQIWKLYRIKEAYEFSFMFPALNIAGRLAGLMLSIQNGSAIFSAFFLVGILLRLTLFGQVVYYRAKGNKAEFD